MSENNLVYSIQRTYILTHVLTPEREIVTCNQRIDIPTIDPLSQVKSVLSHDKPATFVPCIELSGNFLAEFDLKFETNEGVTVLPVKIAPANQYPLGNPYFNFRYALVLPRGATGVKSCKIIHKATGKEVQHNLTFGVMPPPYNYDNALFGYITNMFVEVGGELLNLQDTISRLKLSTKTPTFAFVQLPKGAGKQTINIEDGVLFYEIIFGYNSSEPTHKPKITLSGGDYQFPYTLSLNTTQAAVKIDLFTGKITAYDLNTGETFQQFMLFNTNFSFETLSFENFDDIESPYLYVNPKGASVK